MTHYAPTCTACREHSRTDFHRACDGCRARQAHFAAEVNAPALTTQQLDGADSMFQTLPEKTS